MIPILYKVGETSFTSNGLGRLVDCLSCTVTEERNGIYEAEFTYPITGRFYQTMITDGGIIGVIHDDRHDVQPFTIYKYSAPIDGVVTFNAHHISYDLSTIVVKPFSASSCADVFAKIPLNVVHYCPFTFWTDKAVSSDFDLDVPKAVRNLLCGEEGSVLDVYGKGDYEFDKFAVKLYVNRGVDSGVTIRYGKNITDINHEIDHSGTFSAISPYWTNGETTVTLPEGYILDPNAPKLLIPWTDENGNVITDYNGVPIEFQFVEVKIEPMDFSAEFESVPTAAELRTRAAQYLSDNSPWLPSDNLKVDFVQLWQTPEYENVAALQRVSLCDTVSVYFPELGVIKTKQKVIRVVYDVLLERYSEMELGKLQTTLAEAVAGDFRQDLEETASFLQSAIATATAQITGGLGGYVVLKMNANNEPEELLIMDTPNINTAVNVWRFNQGGLGHSHNGYNGPFDDVALTQDGKINASMITTGYLLANYIKGGTLSLGGYADTNGKFEIQDALGNARVTGNKDGFKIAFDSTNYANFTTSGMYFALNSISSVANGISGYGTLPDGTSLLYQAGNFYWSVNPNSTWNITAYTAPDGLNSEARSNGSLYKRAFCNLNGVGIEKGSSYAFFDTNCNLSVSGTKNRIVDVDQYGKRLLYCYETPSPLFGDLGEGVIGEDGSAYIWLDPIFAKTISTENYQVFLQKYGEGDCWVAERKGSYFLVRGTAGLAFGWELKAKQADYDQRRLDQHLDPEIQVEFSRKGEGE